MALSVLQTRLLKQLYTGAELWVNGFDAFGGTSRRRVHRSTVSALLKRGLIHKVGKVYDNLNLGQRYDLTDKGMAVAKELM